MLPVVLKRDGDRTKMTNDLSGSMLEIEESILRCLEAVGNIARGEALKRFGAGRAPHSPSPGHDADPPPPSGVRCHKRAARRPRRSA